MSPIKQDTIRIEKWTNTTSYPGVVKNQVIAEGDNDDPGTYVLERGIRPDGVSHINSDKKIADILVDETTGEIIEGNGLWRRFLPGAER